MDTAIKICAGLAVGNSLKTVLEADDSLPSMVTVFDWLSKYDDFAKMYARAKEEAADALADDIQDIADQVRRGELEPNAGRVAGDLKKWIAAKLKPRKYGDKLDLAVTQATEVLIYKPEQRPKAIDVEQEPDSD